MMSFISRYFVQSKQCPLAVASWVRRSAQIVDGSGKTLSSHENIETPEFWSQLAVDVAVSKYLRKTGVPQSDGSRGGETSIRQMIERVVVAIEKTGMTLGYFSSSQQAEIFSYELKYILLHQLGSFNSPVWFNCGLFHSYGIEGKGGQYFLNSDSNEIEETHNAYQNPQTSACFIQSVNDDLESIFDLVKKEALVFKYGSGTGTNFSRIRGENEMLEGGEKSSGLIAFLEILDRGAGATRSAGRIRRAAKMVCLDADHPDIKAFIQWKRFEEKKAQALIASGLDSHFEGESYRSVFGQNSNNSVRLSDDFFRRLENKQMWQTVARTTGAVLDEFPADELWTLVAESAWECADPGVQYDSTIQYWNPCSDTEDIRSSNPCSEYMFLDETACNLASLNLTKFLDAAGSFDWKGFRQACRVLFIAQDILVSLSSYPTRAIAERVHQYRPLGLGFSNLGGLFMKKGWAYGDAVSCEMAALIAAEMQYAAQVTSRQLAEKLGAFEKFNDNKNSIQRVFHQHTQSLKKWETSSRWGEHFQKLRENWELENQSLSTVGLRNAQLTAIAPTGTIGLLMDCETLGVEPEFALVKVKKLAGGGEVKMVNAAVRDALIHLSYSESEVQQILEYIESHSSVVGAPHIAPQHLAVFDSAVPEKVGGRSIAAENHLNIMAAIQPFVSGAISKTVNLPESATVDDVKQVYLKGWKLGLKSVAIYRDQSKASQPLNVINLEIAKKSL